MPPPALPRPGWLLPHPLPLRDHHLRILAGPERIETGWWEGDLRRDYYLLQTSQGQRAWAYRCAGDAPRSLDHHPGSSAADGFMLHGWFS